MACYVITSKGKVMDFKEIIKRLAEYNPEAGIFIENILDLSSTWDDLIDRDKQASDSSINRAFQIALVDLPRNKFYMSHFTDLNPILVVAIENWHMANTMERGKMTDMIPVSFIIRSSYVDIITMTAMILGGHSLAQEIGIAARRFAHDEGIGGYIVALGHEESDRRN